MKAVHSSHLALRFYVKDGWEKEELDSLFHQVEMRFPDDICPYYTVEKPKIPLAELVGHFSSIMTWKNQILTDTGLMINYLNEMVE